MKKCNFKSDTLSRSRRHGCINCDLLRKGLINRHSGFAWSREVGRGWTPESRIKECHLEGSDPDASGERREIFFFRVSLTTSWMNVSNPFSFFVKRKISHNGRFLTHVILHFSVRNDIWLDPGVHIRSSCETGMMKFFFQHLPFLLLSSVRSFVQRFYFIRWSSPAALSPSPAASPWHLFFLAWVEWPSEEHYW